MIRRRFYAFTLLELLVSVAIVLAVAAVVGVQAQKAVRQQRFLSSVDAVADHLLIAQQLMQINGMDVRVRFRRLGDHSWALFFGTDRMVPPELARVLPAQLTLREVDSIEILGNKGDGQQLTLNFWSLRQHPPSATLLMVAKDGQRRYLQLQALLQRPKVRALPPLETAEYELESLNQVLFPEELRAL